MSKFFQLLVVIIFLASSINIFAIEMSTEETIKARKAMFKQNYSYAKKMSAAIKKDDKETNNKNGKVTLLRSVANLNFSGSLINPGEIK